MYKTLKNIMNAYNINITDIEEYNDNDITEKLDIDYIYTSSNNKCYNIDYETYKCKSKLSNIKHYCDICNDLPINWDSIYNSKLAPMNPRDLHELNKPKDMFDLLYN